MQVMKMKMGLLLINEIFLEILALIGPFEFLFYVSELYILGIRKCSRRRARRALGSRILKAKRWNSICEYLSVSLFMSGFPITSEQRYSHKELD